MMPEINEKTFLLRESPTRRIDKIRETIVKEGKDIILLSTGQPSIPPPLELRKFLAEKLYEESMKLYGYTPSQGIRELREAISEDLLELGGLELDPDKNIVVTAGGQEAMFASLAGILEDGDEVILTDPTYFGYKPIIEYLGGRVKYTPVTLENRFQPDIDKVNEIISKKTKAMIIVSPDNPTGRVIQKDVAKGLAELANDHGFWLVMDEAYKTLVYEGEHTWVWHYSPDNVIGINTFSKDPGMPGWRIGYVYGPWEFVRAVKLISEEMVYCPPSVAQITVLHYLKSGMRKNFLPKVLKEYVMRRDILIEALNRYLPEVKYLRSQGSMFIFPDFSKYLKELGVSADEFSERLLREASVATVPGSYFGSSKEFIRLSFVTESPERLKIAVRLIREFIDTN
jgi:aspartate aminotransferase